jgi:hypothetical protein
MTKRECKHCHFPDVSPSLFIGGNEIKLIFCCRKAAVDYKHKIEAQEATCNR